MARRSEQSSSNRCTASKGPPPPWSFGSLYGMELVQATRVSGGVKQTAVMTLQLEEPWHQHRLWLLDCFELKNLLRGYALEPTWNSKWPLKGKFVLKFDVGTKRDYFAKWSRAMSDMGIEVLGMELGPREAYRQVRVEVDPPPNVEQGGTGLEDLARPCPDVKTGLVGEKFEWRWVDISDVACYPSFAHSSLKLKEPIHSANSPTTSSSLAGRGTGSAVVEAATSTRYAARSSSSSISSCSVEEAPEHATSNTTQSRDCSFADLVKFVHSAEDVLWDEATEEERSDDKRAVDEMRKFRLGDYDFSARNSPPMLRPYWLRLLEQSRIANEDRGFRWAYHMDSPYDLLRFLQNNIFKNRACGHLTPQTEAIIREAMRGIPAAMSERYASPLTCQRVEELAADFVQTVFPGMAEALRTYLEELEHKRWEKVVEDSTAATTRDLGEDALWTGHHTRRAAYGTTWARCPGKRTWRGGGGA